MDRPFEASRDVRRGFPWISIPSVASIVYWCMQVFGTRESHKSEIARLDMKLARLILIVKAYSPHKSLETSTKIDIDLPSENWPGVKDSILTIAF